MLFRSAPTEAELEEGRSFFRILLNQAPLPATELRPMMTSLLRQTRDLYKSKRLSTSDRATRDFYDYQIIAINRTLEGK